MLSSIYLMSSGRHGAPIEEMAQEVNKTREQLESADKALKYMAQLNTALKASLITRLGKWQEFRRHIALRCKFVFAFHLSHVERCCLTMMRKL